MEKKTLIWNLSVFQFSQIEVPNQMWWELSDVQLINVQPSKQQLVWKVENLLRFSRFKWEKWYKATCLESILIDGWLVLPFCNSTATSLVIASSFRPSSTSALTLTYLNLCEYFGSYLYHPISNKFGLKIAQKRPTSPPLLLSYPQKSPKTLDLEAMTCCFNASSSGFPYLATAATFAVGGNVGGNVGSHRPLRHPGSTVMGTRSSASCNSNLRFSGDEVVDWVDTGGIYRKKWWIWWFLLRCMKYRYIRKTFCISIW